MASQGQLSNSACGDPWVKCSRIGQLPNMHFCTPDQPAPIAARMPRTGAGRCIASRGSLAARRPHGLVRRCNYDRLALCPCIINGLSVRKPGTSTSTGTGSSPKSPTFSCANFFYRLQHGRVVCGRKCEQFRRQLFDGNFGGEGPIPNATPMVARVSRYTLPRYGGRF